MTIEYALADVLPDTGDPSQHPELWEQWCDYWGLSVLGCEVAERLGCEIDVDAYGLAYARLLAKGE